MEKPQVEYPCWWTYAIVGTDEEDLRLVAGEVAKGTEHRVKFSKLSAEKHYTSLHVEILVSNQEARDQFFDAFKSHPRVKFVL
jgi:putative lipoic acid-binding regulatory protein